MAVPSYNGLAIADGPTVGASAFRRLLSLNLSLVLAAMLLVPVTPAAAEDLMVRNPRIGWVPGRLPKRAFFDVVNNGAETVTLVGASSPHFSRIEFKAPPDNDLFILEPLDMPQVIAPGQTLEFRPDGAYLLLMVQSNWVEPGDKATISLLFREREPLDVELTVTKAAR